MNAMYTIALFLVTYFYKIVYRIKHAYVVFLEGKKPNCSPFINNFRIAWVRSLFLRMLFIPSFSLLLRDIGLNSPSY